MYIYIYIIHVQGREDQDEIIIKIINWIYKIFFPPFLYEYNSKNGRNRKILYCKYKIENDSRRLYTNKYMPFFFCFVLFRFGFFSFFFMYTVDFYLLSVAEQPYLHNKRSREKKKTRERKRRNEFQSIRSTTWGSSHVFRISLLQFWKYKQMFRTQISPGFPHPPSPRRQIQMSLLELAKIRRTVQWRSPGF